MDDAFLAPEGALEAASSFNRLVEGWSGSE